MKLYTTLTSPYGRIARIVILEKGLQDHVLLEKAATRTPGSPYYAINPSGRVPYLLLDDGSGIEESSLICEYLDHADGEPSLTAVAKGEGLAAKRLEARARSMLDGLSLWGREYLYRPAEIRSETLVEHEHARAIRLADFFEAHVDSPVMTGALNMAQITLAATLHGRDGTPKGFDWRSGRGKLSAWVDNIGERASVQAPLPPKP